MKTPIFRNPVLDHHRLAIDADRVSANVFSARFSIRRLLQHGITLAIQTVFILVAIGALCTMSASADQSVLLLRNGQLLRGEISSLGDRYHVLLEGGGEIKIPQSQVELHCRDLSDAYQKKCTVIEHGNVESHLRLAEWCSRHGLFAEAAEQIVRAIRIDPRHPRIEATERAIKAASSRFSPPADSETVRSVTAPTVDQLEQLVHGMPAGTVEVFTTVLQPLLIHRCAANGCHSTETKSNFKLFQPPRGQMLTRRFTQRNLHAVLENVDKQSPTESLLLTKAKTAHGPLKVAPMGERDQNSVHQLQAWIEAVSRPKNIAPQTILGQPANLLQTTTVNSDSLQSTEIGPAPQSTATQEKDSPAADAPSKKTSSERKVQRGASFPAAKARDPFDPALFNQNPQK